MGNSTQDSKPEAADIVSCPDQPEHPQDSSQDPAADAVTAGATAAVGSQDDTVFRPVSATEISSATDGSLSRKKVRSRAAKRPPRPCCSKVELASDALLARRRSGTFAWLAPRFQRDCRPRWKPSTFEQHCAQIKRQLLPVLGVMQVSEIRRADVISWYENPATQCTRALAILSCMMRYAEQVGLRPHDSNPCAGLRRKQSAFKAHYPRDGDYREIGEALNQEREAAPVLASVIEFLALTGARKGEALAAEWRHLEGGRLVLPDSKSGPKVIWLPTRARELIEQLPRTPKQRYLFGREPRKRMSSRLDVFWRQLRDRHGLPNMRLHDFRHGFASRAVNLGMDLRVVGRLLGHVEYSTTLGYAQLDDEPLKRATERVGNRLRGRITKAYRGDQDDTLPPHPRRPKGGRRDH